MFGEGTEDVILEKVIVKRGWVLSVDREETFFGEGTDQHWKNPNPLQFGQSIETNDFGRRDWHSVGATAICLSKLRLGSKFLSARQLNSPEVSGRSCKGVLLAMASATKEDVFKPVAKSPQSGDEQPESHGRREDLTEDTEVKAPGVTQRATEEVQAIASEVWAAITPGSKK